MYNNQNNQRPYMSEEERKAQARKDIIDYNLTFGMMDRPHKSGKSLPVGARVLLIIALLAFLAVCYFVLNN